MEQHTGCAAIVSVLAAVGCYFSICGGRPVLAMLLAIISLPLGLVGLLMAAKPRVRGGFLSIVAIGLGLLGLVLSIIAAAGKLVF